ncbi:MAG: 16S rRNA (cytosine(1402)-N(4))-methyltransferase RsmH [Candidatus Cloacimonetes bacterium]|nr:16S rRNA (cytosine(1402)-N(4))-methyltransferase RsmH [Candidatus Cloacimonadota bacterium]
MKDYHEPVLLKESLELLKVESGGIYVDATMGGGGHTEAILHACPETRIIAFDQDPDAVAHCSRHLGRYHQLTVIQDNFRNLRSRLALERIRKINGIIYDLGISSHQIDTASRGFSFSQDGALDMRMSPDLKLTAADIVNRYAKTELAEIFRKYGEEKESLRIAGEIVRIREKNPLRTTHQLAEIIDNALRTQQKIKAKARIFQALRIYVNAELENLEISLQDSVNIMSPGGRIVVISYHSLEDRIVKNFFNFQEKDCICPSSFPRCICDKKSILKVLTRKPVYPDENEYLRNPRARSARLRAAEKKEV